MTSSPLPNLSAPLAIKRGVHRERSIVTGETIYYAITSSGALMRNAMYRLGSEEAEATLVRELWHALNRDDPPTTRRRLYLVRR